jgi:hypothetical protein
MDDLSLARPASREPRRHVLCEARFRKRRSNRMRSHNGSHPAVPGIANFSGCAGLRLRGSARPGERADIGRNYVRGSTRPRTPLPTGQTPVATSWTQVHSATASSHVREQVHGARDPRQARPRPRHTSIRSGAHAPRFLSLLRSSQCQYLIVATLPGRLCWRNSRFARSSRAGDWREVSGNSRDAAMVESGYSEGEDDVPRSDRKYCSCSALRVDITKCEPTNCLRGGCSAIPLAGRVSRSWCRSAEGGRTQAYEPKMPSDPAADGIGSQHGRCNCSSIRS